MKLINIYLVGLFYVLKPTKYMVWNNEIISWRLGLLCMDAWCMLLDIEDIGTGNGYGVLWKLLGIVYGIVIAGCLIYNLLPQQNKKIINLWN